VNKNRLSTVLTVDAGYAREWWKGRIDDVTLCTHIVTHPYDREFVIFIKRNYRENIRGLLSRVGSLVDRERCRGLVWRAIGSRVEKWSHDNYAVRGWRDTLAGIDEEWRYYSAVGAQPFVRLAREVYAKEKRKEGTRGKTRALPEGSNPVNG
jgi:hypothetical protein